MDKESTYIFKQGTSTELVRLSRQDAFMNEIVGDLLPPHLDPFKVESVLDLGSGTGAWCNDLASTYPHISVVGIDNSQQMLEYARMQTQIRKRSNVTYQEMDALSWPLAFPDGAFDLVNGRFIASFVRPASWMGMLGECKRLVKPGGTLRLTEGETGIHTSAAYGKVMSWLAQVFHARGLGFGKGYSIGTQAILASSLRAAGLENIELIPYWLDMSYGTEYYHIWFEAGMLTTRQMKPIVLQFGVSEEEFEQTLLKAVEDLKQPDYCGGGTILSVVGTVP